MQYHYPPSSENNIIGDLTKAMNGEYTAIHFYEQLAKLAPTPEMQKRILEIRQDEIRHYHGFATIYTSLTGHPPSPQIIEALPTDFKSGVLAAFKDEQEAVDFYHRVARQCHIPYISEQFRSNAADEQNHAVWFLFFMTHA